MEWRPIDLENSATNSTLTMFTSENLTYYLALKAVPAVRTFNSLWLRRSMILGIAFVIDTRNITSSRIVISDVQVKQ